MRKFTLLFAFLLSLIGVAQAQTVITDLNSLSNGKVYTLTGERGTLLTFDGATMLYGTFAGDKEGVAYDASDPYQQFAILKSEMGDLYLYNVGLKKFINQGNNCYSLSTYPSHKFEATNASNQDGDYDWLVKVNGQMINLSGSDGGHNTGVNVGYSTEDPGNRFAITEVGTLDDAVKEEVEALINWKATTLPTLSTDAEPVYYSIKNLRSNKYAAHQCTGSRLVQTADEANAGALWYFVDASSSVPEGTTLGEGVLPVYIKNMATGMRIKSADAATYGDDARIWYLIPHTATHTGYVITAGTEVSNWTSWNDAGSTVCHYLGNDAGSIWAFVPTLSAVANTAKAGVPALIANELSAVQTSAIAEAEALGARPYYSYSTDDVNTCKNTIINGIAVTTYAEFLTAKTTIAEALTTLKACTTINPIAGSEYVKIRNYNASSCYMKVKTTETTNEETSEVTTTRTVFDETSVGEESIWTFLAKSDNTGFYLYNPLTALYVKHTGGGNVALVSSQDEASVYSITPEKNYVKIHVGTGNRDYLHHQQDGNVVCWSSDAASSWWYIEKPTDAEIEALNTLLTPLDTLKTEAINAANARVDEIEASDDDLDFYTYDAGKIAELRSIISNMINGATTHAELTEVQVSLNALLNDFVIYEGNRTNPLTAGTKVKFLNKKVNTNYMTTDANGATTSSEVTSASIWELVANDEATGFYLYNNLSDKYLKHATADGGQATLVAKTEATLYKVQPKGQHVVIGEVEPGSNHSYVHCNNGTPFVTRWSDDDDLSLWTVTSATDEELTQLTTDIQTNITTQLDAAVAAANAVVAPYKALEFYRPTQAIDAYEAAIATITGVDTYEELAAALEAITAAQTAFETAIAADDVVLENPVSDGEQVKFFNRQHSTYITVAGDGAEMSASLNFEAGAVWTLKSATNGGFYLYSPVANAYAKHPTGNDKPLALVSSTEDASIYYVHSNGLYVTVGTLAEQSTEENNLDYLHGVNWVDYQKDYNVVCWNAIAQASHWTISSVTPKELEQANNAIKEKVTEELAAYKASAQQTVNAMAALTYYKATTVAVNTYANAVKSLTATSYEDLVVAKAKVDEALAEFMVAPRDESTALSANTRVKFVNKANPTLWMTTDAGGVTASEVVGLESHWVLKASATGNGFYLYNEMSGKYVKHPAENGAQATFVSEEAQATSYEIEPNGFFVLLKDATENTYDEDYLHYGGERYVTRWLANNNASLWNFEVVTDDEFKEFIAHQLDSCKQLALLRISAATKAAFYAPTSEAINVARTAVEAIDVQANSTISGYASALNSINDAMTMMYNNGLTNGATPKGSTKNIRLRNKLYSTHYLGFGENGLYHYETVATENSVAPVDEDLDGEMSVGTVDILHSTESTVWALEDPIVAAADERMYLKNLMIQSYAKHQFHDGSHVQYVIEKAETSPEIIELVGVVKDANHNKTIKYEDMSFVESGEMCFVVYATEGTENTVNTAMSASEDGTIVNAAHTIDASMWAISEATEVELANMDQYRAYAFHQYVFVPTIKAAKQFYCITTEGEGDAAVTTTVDYIDPVKAGYYHYTGGCVDRDGVEIALGDYETFEQEYWYALSTAIAMDQNSEEGAHDLSKAQTLVTTLNEYMKALLLNFPTRDGFFRLRCVQTNAYLQSDVNNNNRCIVSNNTDVSSIFYYDAIEEEGKEGQGSLLSYRDGYYFTQGKNSQNISGIYAKLQPLGKMGDIFQFSRPQNKEFGSYNISSDNTSNQNDRRYMYGAAGNETGGYYVDNGAGATLVTVVLEGDNTGYNWVMERVEELPLKINAFGYATFYAPIALKMPEGVNAYICTGVDEKGELSLTLLENGIIPAGTAVIIRTEDDDIMDTTVYLTEPAADEPQAQLEVDNLLKGTVYKTWRQRDRQNLKGADNYTYGANVNLPTPTETGKVYTLSCENDRIAMYRFVGNKFTHFRAFLDVPTAVSASFDALNFGSFEEPTAIERVPVEVLGNGEIYDLSGRRVLEPGKGVYIVNGKKVYIK